PAFGELYRSVEYVVTEFGGAFRIGNFRRAFEQPQAIHHAGSIVKLGKALQLLVQLARIGAGKAMCLVLDPDPGAEKVEFGQNIAKVGRRIGIVAIGPDDDVLDVRRMTRLP